MKSSSKVADALRGGFGGSKPVIHSGQLWKRGHVVHNWRVRWFVLDKTDLKYYTQRRRGRLKGTIKVSNIVSVRPSNRLFQFCKAAHTFMIEQSTGKTYYMVADSPESCQVWMNIISKVRFGSEVGAVGASGNIFGPTPGVASNSSKVQQLMESDKEAEQGFGKHLQAVIEATDSQTLARLMADALAHVRAYEVTPAMRAAAIAVAQRKHQEDAVREDQPAVWSAEVKSTYGAMMRALAGASDAAAGAGEGVAGSAASGPATPWDEPSTLFSRLYENLGKLGEGASGVVYRVKPVDGSTEMAAKVISRASLDDSAEAALRQEVEIMREVRACPLNPLSHPNVVAFHEFFDDPESAFCVLVAELATGGELFDRIVEQQHFDEEQAARVALTLFATVAFCHMRGIVHRDIKPENVLFADESEEAQLKLADFGFASRVRADDPTSLTTALGSPAYVAPEVISHRAYGAAVDAWSLGVVAYVLLCGYPPFYSDNQAVMFRLIRRGTFAFHPEYWRDVSDDAKDFIRNLLVVKPEKRSTAMDALQHPWLLRISRLPAGAVASGEAPQLPLGMRRRGRGEAGSTEQPLVIRMLHQYQARRRLRAGARTVLTTVRMARFGNALAGGAGNMRVAQEAEGSAAAAEAVPAPQAAAEEEAPLPGEIKGEEEVGRVVEGEGEEEHVTVEDSDVSSSSENSHGWEAEEAADAVHPLAGGDDAGESAGASAGAAPATPSVGKRRRTSLSVRISDSRHVFRSVVTAHTAEDGTAVGHLVRDGPNDDGALLGVVRPGATVSADALLHRRNGVWIRLTEDTEVEPWAEGETVRGAADLARGAGAAVGAVPCSDAGSASQALLPASEEEAAATARGEERWVRATTAQQNEGAQGEQNLGDFSECLLFEPAVVDGE